MKIRVKQHKRNGRTVRAHYKSVSPVRVSSWHTSGPRSKEYKDMVDAQINEKGESEQTDAIMGIHGVPRKVATKNSLGAKKQEVRDSRPKSVRGGKYKGKNTNEKIKDWARRLKD